jgi:predicted component of type VI protein secretion system
MKVSLVVASGAHQGKVIPITGPQFLIGREAQCHLRPASQAISKHHCGVLVRDGQVFVKDFGSTNGTMINDVLVRGAEVQVVDGASVKLGPLDFILRIEASVPQPDGTPLPTSAETSAALAAVKAATSGNKAPVRDATPNPASKPLPATKLMTRPPESAAVPAAKPKPPASKEAVPAKPARDDNQSGSKEAAALKTPPKDGSKESKPLSGSKPAPALKTTPPQPEAVEDSKETQSLSSSRTQLSATSEEDDRMAAMLLGMEDADVPEGSTVVSMPAVEAAAAQAGESGEKKDDKAKKPVQTREDMTNAASDLLKKMMRRPK